MNSMHNSFGGAGGYSGPYPGYVPPPSLSYYNGYPGDLAQISGPYYGKPATPHGYSPNAVGYALHNSSVYYQQYGLGYQYGYGKYGVNYTPDHSAGSGVSSVGGLQAPSTDYGLTGSMFSKGSSKCIASQGTSSPMASAAIVPHAGTSGMSSATPTPPSPSSHTISGGISGPGATPSPPVDADPKKDLDKMRRCQVCGQIFRLMSECLSHMKTAHDSSHSLYAIQHSASQSVTGHGHALSSQNRNVSLNAPDSPLVALERMGWGEKQPILSSLHSAPSLNANYNTTTPQHSIPNQLSYISAKLPNFHHSLSNHNAPEHSKLHPYSSAQSQIACSSSANNEQEQETMESNRMRKQTSYSVSSIIGEGESISCTGNSPQSIQLLNVSIHNDDIRKSESVESNAAICQSKASSQITEVEKRQLSVKVVNENKSVIESPPNSQSSVPPESQNEVPTTDAKNNWNTKVEECSNDKQQTERTDSANISVSKSQVCCMDSSPSGKVESVNNEKPSFNQKQEKTVQVQMHDQCTQLSSGPLGHQMPSQISSRTIQHQQSGHIYIPSQQARVNLPPSSVSIVNINEADEKSYPSSGITISVSQCNQDWQQQHSNQSQSPGNYNQLGQKPNHPGYSWPVNQRFPTNHYTYSYAQGGPNIVTGQQNVPSTKANYCESHINNQFSTHPSSGYSLPQDAGGRPGVNLGHVPGPWYPNNNQKNDMKGSWPSWPNQNTQVGAYCQPYSHYSQQGNIPQTHKQMPHIPAQHNHLVHKSMPMHDVPSPSRISGPHMLSPQLSTVSQQPSPQMHNPSVSSSEEHISVEQNKNSITQEVCTDPEIKILKQNSDAEEKLRHDSAIQSMKYEFVNDELKSDTKLDIILKSNKKLCKIGPKSKIMAVRQSSEFDSAMEYQEHGSVNGYNSSTLTDGSKTGTASSYESSESECSGDDEPRLAQLKPVKRAFTILGRSNTFIGPKRIKIARLIKERQERRHKYIQEQIRLNELEEEMQAEMAERIAAEDDPLGNVLLRSSIILSDSRLAEQENVDKCIASLKAGPIESVLEDIVCEYDGYNRIEYDLSQSINRKAQKKLNASKVFHHEHSVIINDALSIKPLRKLRAKDFKWSHYIKSTKYWCSDCAHGFKNAKEAGQHTEERCKWNCLYMLECYVIVKDVQTHFAYGSKVQELLEEYQIDGNFNCITCGEIILRKADYLVHVDTHKDFMPWECTICGTRFKIRGSLKEHLRYTHMKGRVPCLKCNKVFPTSTLLRQHVKVHTQHYKYKTSKNRGDELKVALEATAGALEPLDNYSTLDDDPEKLSYEASEYRNWCKMMELNAMKNIGSVSQTNPGFAISGENVVSCSDIAASNNYDSNEGCDNMNSANSEISGANS